MCKHVLFLPPTFFPPWFPPVVVFGQNFPDIGVRPHPVVVVGVGVAVVLLYFPPRPIVLLPLPVVAVAAVAALPSADAAVAEAGGEVGGQNQCEKEARFGDHSCYFLRLFLEDCTMCSLLLFIYFSSTVTHSVRQYLQTSPPLALYANSRGKRASKVAPPPPPFFLFTPRL